MEADGTWNLGLVPAGTGCNLDVAKPGAAVDVVLAGGDTPNVVDIALAEI